MIHPNIVKYYKTFVEGEQETFFLLPSPQRFTTKYKTVVVSIVGEKLYVVMELIEGVPLTQHFNSLKEKQQRFTEDRIWSIFIQVQSFLLLPTPILTHLKMSFLQGCPL